MYKKKDYRRYYRETHFDPRDRNEYRTEFRRDLARIIHSHSFRRLVGKTQLFPGHESDFFRNRMTHSLEVAQVAKSIALKINHDYENKFKTIKPIDLDLVELAGLAHDMGHPPFGHQGEEALAEKMRDYGGFEGNAQTLRLLSRIEKKILHKDGEIGKGGFDRNGKDRRGGLNLTYRSLASILKYDSNIAIQKKEYDKIVRDKKDNKYIKNVFKGYYNSELPLVNKIKEYVGENYNFEKFKTIECQIMDIADDITYSTYDLEDAFKAGFISPIEMLIQNRKFYEEVANEVNRAIQRDENVNEDYFIDADTIKDIISDLFKYMFQLPLKWINKLKRQDITKEEYMFLGNQYSMRYNELLTQNGYTRGHFSSQLIKNSINKIKFKLNIENPAFSKIWLDPSDLIRVEILKRIAFKTQVLSPKLKSNEFRGKMIVQKIFEFLTPKNGEIPELLPEDVKILYEQSNEKEHQFRVICDFIACMTDRYAVEFYGRIKSEKPSSIFKP